MIDEDILQELIRKYWWCEWVWWIEDFARELLQSINKYEIVKDVIIEYENDLDKKWGGLYEFDIADFEGWLQSKQQNL